MNQKNQKVMSQKTMNPKVFKEFFPPFCTEQCLGIEHTILLLCPRSSSRAA
jgi:hypothetical protein